MTGKWRKKPSKIKRAVKDRTKGEQTIPFDIHPKVLSSKVERRQIDTSGLKKGQVIAVEGRTYLVETKENHSYTQYRCVPSRSIVTENPNASLLAVGDMVFIRPGTTESDLGMIMIVKERKTKLARRAASSANMEQVIGANIDYLIIVMAADEPPYKKGLIDRYLVAAQKGGLQPVLCINKIDLGDEREIRSDLRVYTDTLGIPLVCVSATKKIHINFLEDLVTDKTSILSGPSGVGKSTLINTLLGQRIQVTADEKKNLHRGQHITTFAQMFRLPKGGYIMDTPGIREFAIWDVTPNELALYFSEFNFFVRDCKFPACTHTHEPDCAVKEALSKGEIDRDRYNSYLRLSKSLQA